MIGPRSIVPLRLIVAAALTALAALGAGGCARPQARTQPEMPALDAPPPPPRRIATVTGTEQEPGPNNGQPRGSRATPGAREPGRESGSRPDTRKPPETPAPVKAEPVPAVPPRGEAASPAETLQTAPTASEAERERSIRELLARASRDLGRVDYRVLNADARAQYDTAKRFIQQGEDALRDRNYVFALKLADKAAALASILLGR